CSSDLNNVDVNWAIMNVDYCNENRVAVGGQERGSRHAAFTFSVLGWQQGIELVDPETAVTGVNLLQGREYALTLTRATDAYMPQQVLEQTNTSRYQLGLPRDIASIGGAHGYPLQPVEYLRDTRGLIISSASPVDRGYALGLEAQGSSDMMPWASNPYAT